MGRAEELAKVERAIKEAEVRLKSLQKNIEAIDAETKKVSVLEAVLIENVRMLKTKQIIAIAQEFKKAKEELRRTTTRLTVLKNDREHFGQALKDVEIFLANAQDDHRRMSIADNNILKFRSKDGKE